MTATPVIKIQSDDFDTGKVLADLSASKTNTGAIVTFTGLCRDEGGRLAALELEHYPAMAQAEIERIATVACERWPVNDLIAIHRHGKIKPGENIVLVVATSSHRQAAFEAASYLMDFLKTRAPFWKKEHMIDGTSGNWVDAREQDEEALKRWDK